MPSELSQAPSAVNNAASFDDLYEQATAAFREERYDAAADLFLQAIGTDPQSDEAYNYLGVCYDRLGRQGDAAAMFRKAVALNGSVELYLTNLGSKLIDIDVDEAIETYKRVLNINPASHIAYNGLGVCYDRKQQTDEAEAAYRKAAELHPDEELYVSNLAALLRQPDPAEEVLQKALQRHPEWHKSWNDLGNIYERGKRYEDAIRMYRKAIVLQPDEVVYYTNLGTTLIAANNIAEAQKAYEDALAVKPDSDVALNGLGVCRERKGLIAEAGEYYRKAVAINPSEGVYLINLGRTLVHTDPEEARILLERAAEINPETNAASYDLGYCWGKRHMPEEANRYYEEKVKQHKNSGQFLRGLGDAYAEQALYSLAFEAFESIPKASPEYVYGLNNKAFFCDKTGDYKQGRATWKAAAEIYEEHLGPNAAKSDNPFWGDHWNHLYYGDLLSAIMQEHSKALGHFIKYKEGEKLAITPFAKMNNALYERAKASLSLEQSGNDYRQMKDNLALARRIFTAKGEDGHSYDETLAMGDLLYLDEDYEGAHKCYEIARTKKDQATDAALGQAICFFAQEQYAKAIPLFEEVRRSDPFSFAARIKLAKAYLMVKSYDKCERELKEIVNHAPKNVDAHIVLGELWLALADNGETDYYEDAECCFTDAITIGTGKERETASRILNRFQEKRRTYKDIDLSALYHMRGYARVKRYENASNKFDQKYLIMAQADFAEAIKADKDNHKARRALDKIHALTRSRAAKWVGRLAPAAIVSIAAIILLLVQLAFFFRNYLPASNRYMLNEQVIGAVKTLNPQAAGQLQAYKGISFLSYDDLIKSLKATAAGMDMNRLAPFLTRETLAVAERPFPEIPPGYYILITFSCMLFMIAGFSLPNLLKLRVGSIELEKQNVEIGTVTTSMGIKR